MIDANRSRRKVAPSGPTASKCDRAKAAPKLRENNPATTRRAGGMRSITGAAGTITLPMRTVRGAPAVVSV